MKPVLQVALDFVDLDRALKVVKEAVSGGADWLEAGTPLIKSEGLNAVRELRKRFPNKKIVADMKVMDAGRIEVEAACKAGANIVTVLGAACDSTIRESVDAAKNLGAEIMVDLINIRDKEKRAKEVVALGANYVSIHTPIDEQMKGMQSFSVINKISKIIKIPIASAGGINSETAPLAVKAGAAIVIVGGAITKAKNAKAATQKIKKSMLKMKPEKTELFKRTTNVLEILKKVSTANLSDAMHRSGDLKEILPVLQNKKIVGRALTVRTYPGDWAKPVEAIDIAKKDDIIVIDAGGVPPAVWGELATNSAVKRKVKGVIIHGAVRDVEEIIKLKFPVYAKTASPTAGEPRGFGEINVPLKIEGVEIRPGDWIVGDSDGIVVVPNSHAVEIANRAMDVLERENRIRGEIVKEKSSLAKVTHLLKWEKK